MSEKTITQKDTVKSKASKSSKVELNLKPYKDWGFKVNNKIVITGPCSAETQEQVIQTAEQLKGKRVDFLRAGIWKPRTRPNSFEGVGAIGLPWLKEAGKILNVPITVEVANAKHVEEALKADVDVLWLGARTSVNPFAVQEIADSLKGVDIPVFVKNPINPDLSLWLGALERINKVGIDRLGAIHRGFSSFGNSKWRNRPLWELPIELKRQVPELILICDPSHICGRRDTLLEVAQKSMDLSFDGIMLESHIDPDNAWSDAKQQVTPSQFGELLDAVTLRDTGGAKVAEDLEFLRGEIDQIDDEIIEILSKRMEVARAIGEYKKKNDITILQPNRWGSIKNSRTEQGTNKGLTPDFIEALYDSIHKESIRHQTQIMNNE